MKEMKEVIEGFSLSPQQENLWDQHSLREDSPLWTIATLKIEGKLDIQLLEDSIKQLIERHEILRTNYVSYEGLNLPLQVCRESIGSFWADDVSKENLNSPIIVEIEKVSEELYLIKLSVLAMSIDRKGMYLLFDELQTIYRGDLHTLDEPLQYADISEWLNESLESEETVAGRLFWAQQEFVDTENQKLVFQKSTNSEKSHKQHYKTYISKNLTKKVREFCHEQGIEKSDFFLTCWTVLLWRLLRQENILVGLKLDGRFIPDIEKAIGLLEKNVPLQISFGENDKFKDTLKQVLEKVKELQKWQISYSGKIDTSKWAGKVVADNYSNVFEYLEEYVSFEQVTTKWTLEKVETKTDLSNIKLICREKKDRYQLTFEFYNELFTEQIIQIIAEQFKPLVKSVINYPNRRNATHNLLSPKCYKRIIEQINNTENTGISDELLHSKFEKQAELSPDKIAVCFEKKTITYRDLNKLSNRLARILIEKGLGIGSVIGICLDRSFEQVLSILASLKIGAIYLPLDPTYPAERLQYKVNDSHPQCLILQEKFNGIFENEEIEKFSFSVEELKTSNLSDKKLDFEPNENNLAYIIYTSGSTGRPKGVMVSHRSINNRISWMIDAIDLRDDDVFIYKTPFSFDASIWELFVPLSIGSKLIIAEPQGHKDTSYLIKTIQNEDVTILQLVPSLLKVFLEDKSVSECKSLRKVFCGGESLSNDLKREFYSKLDADLYNLYGPTESSIDASYFACVRDSGEQVETIGSPIDNVKIYILDEDMKQLPFGIVGEIYLGGSGLARGYYNKPDLTAEKFVPNPFSKTEGERLYRTGDLGRFLPEGIIEFLGRIDYQVKIRGFRVETGEIEQVLKNHLMIRDAVVLMEDAEAGKVLNAYLVPKDKSELVETNNNLKKLPNDLLVFEMNKNETDILYREVFENDGYLQKGITLKDGDCIFDVGANIGFFSLFINQICKPSRVFAFEPIPPTYEILKKNVRLYNLPVEPIMCGLAEKSGEADFTFYPTISAMSGQYADSEADEKVTRNYLQNLDISLSDIADELVKDRFTGQNFKCELKTVSDVIRENKLKQIDLLKIDVEKSEMDVLLGIKGEDWAKIKQVVIEVHNIDNRLEIIKDLLKEKDFDIYVEQDPLLAETGMYNLFASRNGLEQTGLHGKNGHNTSLKLEPNYENLFLTRDGLREYLKTKLTEHMIPTNFSLVEKMPVTPNGKLDRNGLPFIKSIQLKTEENYIPPETDLEKEVAEIWAKVLKVEKIGRNEDFFDLGGHSLLLTKVVTRVRDKFNVDISLRSLFDNSKFDKFVNVIEEARKNAEKSDGEKILPQKDLDYYPLSFSQKRLWFLHQMEPQSSAYNLSTSILLKGKLDINSLNRALHKIVQKHGTLRTQFLTVEGKPVQKIVPFDKSNFEIINLSNIEESKKEESIKKRLNEESRKPFDLSSGKLFRATLIRLSEEENILIFNVHHIASDGWSLNILIKEFSQLYSAFLNDQPILLNNLEIQYTDYSIWQENYLKGEKLQKQVDYWINHIGQNPPNLELPTDKIRPDLLSGKGSRVRFTVSNSLRQKIAYFSKTNNATMFMTLLSAFVALLSKYSNQEEIIIGTPTANRNRIEIESIIGVFINTIVIKSDLSKKPSFESLLQQVKETTVSAQNNQDLPFEMLVEKIHPNRNLNRHPLFQVMFNYQNELEESLSLPNLEISTIDFENASSMFDLTLTVVESSNQLGIEFEYSTDLFKEETIEQMNKNFQTILEKAISQPKTSLSRISLLSQEEIDKKIEQERPTKTQLDYLVFHQMFEEQVFKTPDRVAVIQGENSLTFKQLNEKVNQLARFLKTQGIGSERIVCIYKNRSIETIISMLAILKTGAAYTPLEPDTPIERLNLILKQINNPFVITDGEYLDKIEISSDRKICLRNDDEIISKFPVHNLEETAVTENLAYMIFTSGSTGFPKGVMVSHKALCNHLKWILDFFPSAEAQKNILTTSTGFDASIWDLHKPLMSGGTCVIMETKENLNFSYLIEQIQKHKITELQITPTLLNHLLKTPNFEKCKSLKAVYSGGESLPLETYKKFHKILDCPLFNTYGPTETTVEACVFDDRQSSFDEKVTIGKSISNKSVYLLDENLNLVPNGIPGEIFIGGAGVARGYYESPSETATRFLPNPFSNVSGDVFFRTGDFGRYLSNGEIEFLGRKDRQIKINGQRLELKEIEVTCIEHPDIKEAAIIPQTHRGKDVLVGLLVTEFNTKPSANEIRSFLRKYLPEYAIPIAFEWSDKIPILPSGKIDYRSLPKIKIEEVEKSADYVSPQTETQKKIVEIWQLILERKNIGLYDNFFDLGGHSLLLIQVLEKLKREFDKEINIMNLFSYPTVNSLAEFLTSESSVEIDLSKVKSRIDKRRKLTLKRKNIRQKRQPN